MEDKQANNVMGMTYTSMSSQAPNDAPSFYTVQADTETLQTIAKSLWGDSSLWYVIADTNGMGAPGPLQAGQTLRIPTRMTTVHNTSDTFKPYSANDAIGDVTPLPVPSSSGGGCGTIGAMVAIVIAAVVTAYTAGAAAGLLASTETVFGSAAAGANALGMAVGGAIGGAAGSIAGQTFSIAAGMQSGSDWHGVATSAIGCAVSGAVNGAGLFDGMDESWQTAASRAALSSTISQGINIATGLQHGFDWRSVAASSVGAGVGEQVSGMNLPFGRFGNAVAANFAGGTTTALLRDGKVDLALVAADAFGNALGSSLAGGPENTTKANDPFDGIDMQNMIKNGKLTASLGGPSSQMSSWSGDGELMSTDDPYGQVYANEYEYQNRENESGLQPTPDISADDLTMQRVVVTGKRLNSQAQEAQYKYQARASMPIVGRAPVITKKSNGKKVIDLSNPLLNAGLTNGLQKLQSLTPSQIYKLRNSGTPIPGSTMTKTDAIERYAGFDRKLFFALGSNEIAANLDRLQPYVSSAAQESKVSSDLINAILTRESKGMQNAVSGTGALGSSQLTYWIYGPSKALGDAVNPFDPAAAISRQAEYLGQLSKHYDGDLDKTVAAYNQGQPPVDKAIKNYGAQWLNHIDTEGRNYVTYISSILRGDSRVPGYFGTKR